MEQELFNPQSSSVSSSRIIYTPSTFARTSLLHLQEVGSLQAVHPHVSQREDLVSFLCFIVLSGEGHLTISSRFSGATSMHRLFQLCMRNTRSGDGTNSRGQTS